MAITGFQCGKCREVFADPDTCMDHFIKEHTDMQIPEPHSAVCYKCGVRQPSVGMIIVSHNTEGEMLFCDWTCLHHYAEDVITP